LKSPTVKTISEAEFTRQILQLAALLGWRTLHVRPGRTLSGWKTCVQGDGAGFPDVLMIHRVSGKLLVAELKANHGQLSAEQSEWLEQFRAAGVAAYCWRPKDWPLLERVLRGEA
jgi:hypothetical protein